MKRLFSTLCLIAICMAVQNPAFAKMSTQDAQKFLMTIPGFEGRTGALDAAISRAEFLKAVTSLLYGEKAIASCLSRHEFRGGLLFADAESNRWYAPYACAAWENELISGYADGSLQPDKAINYAEAAKILARGFGLLTLPVVDSSPWYKVFVEALRMSGINADGSLRPDSLVPRLAMAEMLSILTGSSPSDDPIVSRDRSVIGWIPYWDQPNAFESFKNNASFFDYVSLFWYRLDAQGNVTTYQYANEDTSIIEFAKQHNVKVLALIANLPEYFEGGDWDADRVQRVIGSASARSRHVADLVALVDRHDFDGINIDYEALRGSQRNDFTLFIKELSEALHKKGKVLGVALHPKTGENNPWEDNGSHAQDWLELAKYADQLHFMTYGEHYLESDAGPVASDAWVTHVLDYAVDRLGVDPSKIYMGLGLYGQEWYEGSNGNMIGVDDELTLRKASRKLEESRAKVQWDYSSGSPYFAFYPSERSGRKHVIWFENGNSIETKIDVALKNRVTGLALWRLGGETEDVWPVIQRFVHR